MRLRSRPKGNRARSRSQRLPRPTWWPSSRKKPISKEANMQTAPAMPSANLNMILDQVAKDKGIERPVLVETLEQAIKQAAQKTFGMERNIEATFNVEKGVVQLFQAIQIVPEVADPFNQISLDEA